MRKHYKKGEKVYIRTIGYSPHMQGIFIIKRWAWWSNYPYRVDYQGKEQLLMKIEVHKIVLH